MLRAMTEERQPSSLRGRLADVYVPALVEGTTDSLAKRLGNRATDATRTSGDERDLAVQAERGRRVDHR